ncbi:PHB depolymerase family esterase [uncultured Corynebacterium sp.]|uniref:alpha/beta hydrolase family esterase n=1 Tax=uncultured Corynebacterium sp. TaxID=159447 RepID=UPI0026161822|nr:alpha/beta hydrolase-fold protein [uncultured Corynebacterium sp.]
MTHVTAVKNVKAVGSVTTGNAAGAGRHLGSRALRFALRMAVPVAMTLAMLATMLVGGAGVASAQEAPAPVPAPAPAPAPKSAPVPKPAPAPKPASTIDRANPGQPENIEFTRPDGSIRSAIVSVTSNYDPHKPTPVLFGFGGRDDTPENYRSYSRFSNTGAASEAIVVYPRGIDNAWEGAPYATSKRGQDVDFVRQIVNELDRKFNVDRNRIYATGMSNGGGFVMNLACQAPDLIAGVVSVSGAFYNPVNEGCAPESVPTFVIHGQQDELTHYNGGTLHNAPYLPAPRLIHSRALRNGCAPQPVVEQKPNNVTQFGYPGCRDEAVFWRINDQGTTGTLRPTSPTRPGTS